MTRLYVGGTFDLFHAGHVKLLERAAKLGTVIVGLNTDEFAARYKRAPVMPLEERRTMLEGCRYVEEVLVNWAGEDSRDIILKAKPNFVVHGSDWMGDDLMKQMGLTKKFMNENRIAFLYLPYTTGISTSDIIERCKNA